MTTRTPLPKFLLAVFALLVGASAAAPAQAVLPGQQVAALHAIQPIEADASAAWQDEQAAQSSVARDGDETLPALAYAVLPAKIRLSLAFERRDRPLE